MLNDRERQCLAAIERHLRRSDPWLVARFRTLDTARTGRRTRSVHRSVHAAGTIPCLMLAAAMLLVFAGAAAGAMTVVVAGVVVALLTVGVAATTVARPGPGFA